MSAHHRHRMPFGAEVQDDGRVRFRLWAPGADVVELCLGTGETEVCLEMAREQSGWFGLMTAKATEGTLYRFRINGDMQVPDPASRHQPEDVHGASRVVDPREFQWHDDHWRGRPWEETVLYELHVGTFTPAGTLRAAVDHLDGLVELGVTAVELMPLADFPGTRNWGYDGVLQFAPDSQYGTPDDLKYFVQTAHEKGLMVFLDVVYNHFGPEGNYLHVYAPQFFNPRHETPWGAAINFDGEHHHWVRQFFIHNALFWLEEYRFDGLRLDAVHAIRDDSSTDILQELAAKVQRSLGFDREIHLVLENDDNAARYLDRDDNGRPTLYTAQWNDDIHHVLHVIATGEHHGYYADYADRPVARLARCLGEGFAYQGDPSAFRDGQSRGEPSSHLPPTAFVSFIQNHDQVGNRAFGERLGALTEGPTLQALTTLWLLAPSPPLLFMGQEWNAPQPFPFFCDFGDDLADAVVNGRRQEFARFPEFTDPAARERIPNPIAPETFASAVLDPQARHHNEARRWWNLHHDLLQIRAREIAPRLRGMGGHQNDWQLLDDRGLVFRFRLGDGARLTLSANLSGQALGGFPGPEGRLLAATTPGAMADTLEPWTVFWHLTPAEGA